LTEKECQKFSIEGKYEIVTREFEETLMRIQTKVYMPDESYFSNNDMTAFILYDTSYQKKGEFRAVLENSAYSLLYVDGTPN
jgi:hypothetical protein